MTEPTKPILIICILTRLHICKHSYNRNWNYDVWIICYSILMLVFFFCFDRVYTAQRRVCVFYFNLAINKQEGSTSLDPYTFVAVNVVHYYFSVSVSLRSYGLFLFHRNILFLPWLRFLLVFFSCSMFCISFELWQNTMIAYSTRSNPLSSCLRAKWLVFMYLHNFFSHHRCCRCCCCRWQICHR